MTSVDAHSPKNRERKDTNELSFPHTRCKLGGMCGDGRPRVVEIRQIKAFLVLVPHYR